METADQTKSIARFSPAIIIFIAVLLRIAYFAEIVHTPAFSHPIYDPEYNAYWARGIATDDWTVPAGVNDPEITSTPHGRPPGYPWFLSAIYLLFGVNDYAPRIVQMSLGVLNALLLYLLGKRIFGNAVGLTAGLLMATYWAFPYFEGILTYPSLAVFLILCLLLTLERWRLTPSMSKVITAGALLGCFALLRPNVLLFAPVLALWMGCLLFRMHARWKTTFLSLLLLALSCTIVLIPAFVRNYLVARDFVFISAYGGINLYVGNHPDASLVEPRIPELTELAGIENWTCFDYPAIVRGLADREGWESPSFSQANGYFYRKAFSFIQDDPGLFFKNLFVKTLLFWGPHEITNDTVMEYDKQYSTVLRFLPGFPWFAALFVFGSLRVMVRPTLLRASPHRNQLAIVTLLWLYVATYFLSVIIYFVAGRYRMPVLPVMLLFGAVGIIELLNSLFSRRLTSFCAGSMLFILLVILFRLNPTEYAPNPGTWHLRTALAYAAAGDDAQAEREYHAALEYGRNASVIYTNLGRLHIARGDVEGGIELYREGLRHNPENHFIHNNLGYELYMEGNHEEATHHFEQAIAFNPRFDLAHINLGNLLMDIGESDKAAYHFEQAAMIEPNNPAAHYNAARAYFESGNYDRAISGYQQAISLKPSFVEALNNLGYVHFILKEYDLAIAYYEKAITVNPDFLLAYNNLGNTYFEMGTFDAAENAYNRALERNEEDIYARYNLGRVFAKRRQWEHAIGVMQQILETTPDYVPAMLLLAEIYFGNNKSADAARILEKASELSPGDINILLLLGEAQECSGDTLSALNTYDKAVDILRSKDGRKK
jgi:tetratricopeptide (TPR) repeat protein